MAFLELAIIVLLFGGMAAVFGAQERAEERRILAWAEEVLARERGTTFVYQPDALPEAPVAPVETEADRSAPGAARPLQGVV